VFFKLADGQPVKPVCLEAQGKTMCLTLLNDKRHTLGKEFKMVQHGPNVLGEDLEQKPLRIGDNVSFKILTVPVDTLTAEQLYNCFLDIHSAALLEWIFLKLNKPSLKGRITIKRI
jgi:hypothetical protein